MGRLRLEERIPGTVYRLCSSNRSLPVSDSLIEIDNIGFHIGSMSLISLVPISHAVLPLYLKNNSVDQSKFITRR